MASETHGTVDSRIIQADFDRLAPLSREQWDHNVQYHRFLLRQLPPRLGQALDLGCGTGAFARALARRADRVLALDLAPEMIRVARTRSRGCTNVDYQVADALDWRWPEAQFACIVSIAALHHLPLPELLLRMRRALRRGGTLLVLDLYRTEHLWERAAVATVAPLSVAERVWHNRRLRADAATRRAWAEHAQHDRYLTLSEVRRACAGLLPGARVRRHLFWRYSIIWRA
jgi:ubiquinone/menaquinone biosynthesis C-methylase UbiE